MFKVELRKMFQSKLFIYSLITIFVLNVIIIFIMRPQSSYYQTYQRNFYQEISGPMNQDSYDYIQTKLNQLQQMSYDSAHNLKEPEYSEIFHTGNSIDDFFMYYAIFNEYNRLLEFNQSMDYQSKQQEKNMLFLQQQLGPQELKEYILNNNKVTSRRVVDYEYTIGINRLLEYEVSILLILMIGIIFAVYSIWYDKESEMKELQKYMNPHNRYNLIIKWFVLILMNFVFIGCIVISELFTFNAIDLIRGWHVPLYQLISHQESTVSLNIYSIYFLKYAIVFLNLVIIEGLILLLFTYKNKKETLVCIILGIALALTNPFNSLINQKYYNPKIGILYNFVVIFMILAIILWKVGKHDEAYN